MARPPKQGLDYFSFDVGFFEDIKVRKIVKGCGANATSILICLLCNVYRNDGYYIVWDEDLPFVIADVVGVSEGAVIEVIKKAIQVGFFSQEMYDKHNILTSHGIQKRFLQATYQRKGTAIKSDYLINHAINSINHVKNPINHNDNRQSKVKEKKVKEKNSTNVEQKKTVAAKAATLKRKEEFYASLIPFVEKYGKQMIREFFDYWSEMNKSETKMRYEKQPTWEIGRRLTTWAAKEPIINNKPKTDKYEQKRIDSEQRKLDSLSAIRRCNEEAEQRRRELEAEGII